MLAHPSPPEDRATETATISLPLALPLGRGVPLREQLGDHKTDGRQHRIHQRFAVHVGQGSIRFHSSSSKFAPLSFRDTGQKVVNQKNEKSRRALSCDRAPQLCVKLFQPL